MEANVFNKDEFIKSVKENVKIYIVKRWTKRHSRKFFRRFPTR